MVQELSRNVRKKGFLLAFVLIIFVILFIFGTALVAFTQSDIRFAQVQENRVLVFYLAKSGINYYLSKGLSEKKRVYLNDAKTMGFDIELKDNLFYSTGIITDGNEKIIHKMTIVTQLSDMGIVCEP